jgi:hypothetical protein
MMTEAGLFHDPDWGMIQKKKPFIRFAHSRSFLSSPDSGRVRAWFRQKSPALSCKAFSFVGVAELLLYVILLIFNI